MPRYNASLKPRARELRDAMTDAELCLWQRLRRKQILGVQFYRQRPISRYIVDFYCSKAKLVIELDGSQHLTEEARLKDQRRTLNLEKLGLKVIRFDNLQVLQETDAVVEVIAQVVGERLC